MGFFSTIDALITNNEFSIIGLDVLNKLIGERLLFKRNDYLITLSYKNLKNDFLCDNIMVRKYEVEYIPMCNLRIPELFYGILDSVKDNEDRSINNRSLRNVTIYVTIDNKDYDLMIRHE